MMTELQTRTATRGELTQDDATHIFNRWPDLRRSPIADHQTADLIRADIARLSVPCNHAWLMARIGSLLHPYYAGSAPQVSIEMMAEDWAIALGEYPQWAIDAGVRWWKSRKNPEHKRKPLEGDIDAAVRRKMGFVFLGESAIRHFDAGHRPIPDQPEEPRATPDQIAAILAEKEFDPATGFAKKMNSKPKVDRGLTFEGVPE